MNDSAGRPLAAVTGGSSCICSELACESARNGDDVVVARDHANLSDAAGRLRGRGATMTAHASDRSPEDGADNLGRTLKSSGCPDDVFCVDTGVDLGGAHQSELPT